MDSQNEQLRNLRSKFISDGVGSTTTNYIESARGALLRDVEGREFIDFAGGIGTMNIGHCHPRVVAAVKEQAEKFMHTCFLVNPYESAVHLAQKLCQIAPGDFPKKAVFLNCGAEAVENAVKIARYYTKRPAIIVFENGYHGRTLLTMTMTSKVKPYKFGFGPFAPEIYRIPFGDTAGPDKLNDFFIKQVNPEAVADEAKQLTAFCLEKGLLVLSCGSYGNVIRVLAPFVITDEQLENGLGILEDGLKDISN